MTRLLLLRLSAAVAALAALLALVAPPGASADPDDAARRTGQFDPRTGEPYGSVTFGRPASENRSATVRVESYNYAGTTDVDQTLTATYDSTRTGAPYVVVIHGGSWAAGTQATIQKPVDLFRSQGYQVFNLSYRLTMDYTRNPGVPWSQQRADLVTARNWIRANAAKFGINPNRGAVYGYSSGGHLAANLGLDGDGQYFRAVISVGGILQPHRLANVVNGLHPGERPTAYMRTIVQWETVAMRCAYVAWTDCAARWKQFLPETHISANDPPVFILAGEVDPVTTHQSARAFAYHLGRSRATDTLIVAKGLGHTDQLALADTSRRTQMLAFLAKNTR